MCVARFRGVHVYLGLEGYMRLGSNFFYVTAKIHWFGLGQFFFFLISNLNQW